MSMDWDDAEATTNQSGDLLGMFHQPLYGMISWNQSTRIFQVVYRLTLGVSYVSWTLSQTNHPSSWIVIPSGNSTVSY